MLPATPTLPVLSTSNDTIAVLIKFRNSCAKKPSRSLLCVVSSIGIGVLAFARVLGDRTGDGVVQAPVQRPEIGGADRRIQLDGQLRDGLTDVTIIVDDL